MGYDLDRFQEVIDEELICSICSGVLQAPVQVSECEHYFCRACIEHWLLESPTCPMDRTPINTSGLGPVPRIMRNLLSRLNISCEYAAYGCAEVLKLDGLSTHREVCPHKPVIQVSSVSQLLANINAKLRAYGEQLDECLNEVTRLKQEVVEINNQMAELMFRMGIEESDQA